ncbi:hypothetical protein ABFT80_04460 [Mesorhizobium sp. SB112]|uniref:hypothetical protein n=1 Tax=Mesorhizobium sp. SB112 TaxID=3151853 RepID=UPI003263E950
MARRRATFLGEPGDGGVTYNIDRDAANVDGKVGVSLLQAFKGNRQNFVIENQSGIETIAPLIGVVEPDDGTVGQAIGCNDALRHRILLDNGAVRRLA